jgi:hypothetical protein
MNREGSFRYSDTAEMGTFWGNSKTPIRGRTPLGAGCRILSSNDWRLQTAMLHCWLRPVAPPQSGSPCGPCRTEPGLCIGHKEPQQQHAVGWWIASANAKIGLDSTAINNMSAWMRRIRYLLLSNSCERNPYLSAAQPVLLPT